MVPDPEYSAVPVDPRRESQFPHPTLNQTAVWSKRKLLRVRFVNNREIFEAAVGQPLRKTGTLDRRGDVTRETATYRQTVRSVLPGMIYLEGVGEWHSDVPVHDIEILEWEDPPMPGAQSATPGGS
jgi:hypothetical protein